MIYIDFQGGAHGNFLEFVCNKHIAGIATVGSPFNSLGAAHNKLYLEDKQFSAWHYFLFNGKRTTPETGKIISIHIDHADLLLLMSISLLRAGDWNIDNKDLDIDTFNKLNNFSYKWVLDNIIENFFYNQVKNSYDAVKDPSWPDVYSISDFNALPDPIRNECLEQHNLKLIELSADSPNCPRSILVEFFKIGFKNPAVNGFIDRQTNLMYYSSNNDVVYFPYSAFYNTDKFIQQIQQLAIWTGSTLKNRAGLEQLHCDFLARQPYINSKIYCDDIFEKIVSGELDALPTLDILQESYLLAQLETKFNLTDLFSISDFFKFKD